jgi:predicted kinase
MSGKLIAMSGIPGSGKSTMARKMVKEGPETVVIVSRDSIRSMLGDYWVPSRENLVSSIERSSIDHGLLAGYTVIVDATNISKKTRDQLKYIADLNEAPFHIIECPVGFYTAIWRDFWRGFFGGRKVGSKVIKKFYKQLHG